MSLKNVIEGLVDTGTTDPEQARREMLHRLERAREAFAQGEEQQLGSGWLTRSEAGRVAFAPTRPDGQQLVIGGQSVNFWHEREIPGVLDAFARAIAAGDLDPQLTGGTPAGHSLPLDRLAP